VYIATNEQTATSLIMTGYNNYSDVQIDFWHGKIKFENTDLEMIEGQITPK
jgi:hypothetical protein